MAAVPPSVVAAPDVRWGTGPARGILLATVAASALAFLDATSANVALPAIGDDLNASVAGLQWIITAYTLTLASLILLAGSMADRFGRRRLFVVGVVWFALASLLCGLAPTVEVLVAARALQGAGAAILTPGSLAILQASFVQQDRARAIGAWSGLSGIAAALGPLVGGWLVQLASWRLIYLTNLPVAVLALYAIHRWVPESRDPAAAGRIDGTGALLVTVGLAGVTWALIHGGERGADVATVVAGAAGMAALAAFLAVQVHRRDPLLPLKLFSNRQFTGVNLVTLAVYAALGALFFLLMLQLQQVVGYSPVEAGLAALPITALLLLLSARAGALAERVGPRWPMVAGSLAMAVGAFLLAGVSAGAEYIRHILPGVTVFGLGLAATVAPLTATVLAAAEQRYAGVASGVNNALSRGAGLVAVALLPGLVGLTGGAYTDPVLFSQGYRTAMLITSGLLVAGAGVAALAVRDHLVEPGDACPYSRRPRKYHCPVDGAPLSPPEVERLPRVG